MLRRLYGPIAVTFALPFVALAGCSAPEQAPRAVLPEPGRIPSTAPLPETSPERLRFVVLSDRTGGERAHVFERAVEQVNLLQPDIVMCVGDLIEGYSAEAATVNGQWDELERIVSELDAPFFYTVGNHDISNRDMAAIWRERRGSPYYHFVYADTLFLVLNTEQRHFEGGYDPQAVYAEKAIGANPGVRHTFVFMHQPVWHADAAWWRRIERALEARPYTVFAGHRHQYAKSEAAGGVYYRLGTTGGGSSLSGPTMGSMDHFVWVTLNDEGPVVTNVLLDGLLPDDVATEESLQLVDRLREGLWVTPVTALTPEKGWCTLHVANPLEKPLVFKVALTARGINVGPAFAEEVIAPGEIKELPFWFGASESSPDGPTGIAEINWSAVLTGEDGKARDISGVLRVGMEPERACLPATSDVKVDGDLSEWGKLRYSCEKPMQIKFEPATWTGPSDCSFEFDTRYDDEFVYIALRVRDDVNLFSPKSLPWSQDGVEVRVNIDPWTHGKEPDKNRPSPRLLFGLSGGKTVDEMVYFRRNSMPEGTQAVCLGTEDGHVTEIAIPVAHMNAATGGDWHTFQLSVTVDDYDDPKQPGAQLWWQPDPGSPQGYVGSGTFVKRK